MIDYKNQTKDDRYMANIEELCRQAVRFIMEVLCLYAIVILAVALTIKLWR
jgi:hypothetical protein